MYLRFDDADAVSWFLGGLERMSFAEMENVVQQPVEIVVGMFKIAKIGLGERHTVKGELHLS